MKLAVGTTSAMKLEFLAETLKELKLDYSLAPFDVPSGVSEQPISSEETKKGSINRAKAALANCKDADMGIGIEVGYHPNQDGNYKMFCWASIVDRSGRQVSSQSHKLLLPPFHQKVLKDDRHMGEHVQQYLAENLDDLSQEIGTIIRFRKPFIQTSIKLALLEYLVSSR